MSVQHGSMMPNAMARGSMARVALPQVAMQTREMQPGLGGSAALSAGTGTGLGGGALTRAVERWRRALVHEQAPPSLGSAGGPSGSSAGSAAPAPAAASSSAVDAEALAALARRLDDSGCSYGRVSAARLDSVTRAYDRLETKMNAVLMAVTGTFLSTLAGLLLYYVRGAGQ